MCNIEKTSAKKTWVVRSSIWVMSSWGSLPSGREVAGRPLPPWPTPEIKLLTLANPCAVSYQTFNMKRKCNPLVRSCFVNEDRFVSSDVYHKRPRTHFLNFHAARCNRVTSLDPNHAKSTLREYSEHSQKTFREHMSEDGANASGIMQCAMGRKCSRGSKCKLQRRVF